jgi:hypothetical protein
MMLENIEVSNNPTIQGHLEQLKDIQVKLSDHLLHPQATYKKVANRCRLSSSPEKPMFQVGDRVWLVRCNVKTTRLYNKLDYQRLSPFLISHQINDVAFRLDLSQEMCLHPVFHVSLLEPWVLATIPGRVIPPPPPVQLVKGPEYEVEAILDSKIIRNKLYYLLD